jgi:hypothetical protein
VQGAPAEVLNDSITIEPRHPNLARCAYIKDVYEA